MVIVSNPASPNYTVTFDPGIPWSGVVGTLMNGSGTTQIAIRNTIANTGHANIAWSVYISTDKTLDVADTLVSQGTAAPLGPSPASTTVDFGAGAVWPAAGGLYFLIATVRATDDPDLTNDAVTGHACAVGTYRYVEGAENNSAIGPKMNPASQDPLTSDTGLNGATKLAVGQTLAIEGVMDALGAYDTYRFNTSNAASATLSMRTMWATGKDDLDFHLWDTVTTADIATQSLGQDTEPIYAPFDVTLPSARPCYAGVYMWRENDPANNLPNKYVMLVYLH